MQQLDLVTPAREFIEPYCSAANLNTRVYVYVTKQERDVWVRFASIYGLSLTKFVRLAVRFMMLNPHLLETLLDEAHNHEQN